MLNIIQPILNMKMKNMHKTKKVGGALMKNMYTNKKALSYRGASIKSDDMLYECLLLT